MPRLWTIRNETLRALNQSSRARFVKSLYGDLAVSYPKDLEKLGEARFKAAIESGILAAAELKIDVEADVADFVGLYFRSGQDVEGRWPWSEDILRNFQLDARTRLELVQQLLP